MFSERRLTEAYQNARIEYFDEKSRYIFFSDSHRGDNSLSDEFARNQNIFLYALKHYYYEGYTYIEVGDGDELWEYSHFKHIRIAHSDIFNFLQRFHDEERMIMIYGNHNMALRNKEYVRRNLHYYYDEYNEEEKPLFYGLEPVEAVLLKHKSTGQEILTVHGHQGDLMNDQLWMISMLMMRYFWRLMHVIGFQNPSSPAKNAQKRHKIEITYNKWIENARKMLICGHTHRPKFPKSDDLPYFNTGCCIHSRGITGIEIDAGKIMLVEWRIRADREGTLQIARKIIRGPEPIEKYDLSFL